MQCKTERLVGGVVVLEIGAEGLGDISTDVTGRIRDLADEGRTKFLLDLSGVSSLDSHGFGDLVAQVSRRPLGSAHAWRSATSMRMSQGHSAS